MADKKISALTGATTPLAGTEVLPIVQGGSTVKVSIANVTAGRAVSTGALSVVGANVTLDNAFSLVGKLAGGTSVGMMRRNSSDEVAIDEDGYGTKIGFGGRYSFAGGGDFTVGIGNLVVGTAGKGIDFSANGGDVLTQYDEGSYTATMAPTTSGTITLAGTHNTLAYTRVGRMVSVTGTLMVSSVSSPVGAIQINTPFAAASGNSLNSAISLMVNGSNGPLSADFVGYVAAGTSTLIIFLGDGNFLQSDSADAMQANTQVTISATYFM